MFRECANEAVWQMAALTESQYFSLSYRNRLAGKTLRAGFAFPVPPAGEKGSPEGQVPLVHAAEARGLGQRPRRNDSRASARKKTAPFRKFCCSFRKFEL